MANIKINIIDVNRDHEIDQNEVITSIVPDSSTDQSKKSHVEKSIMKIKPKKERIHDKGFEL